MLNIYLNTDNSSSACWVTLTLLILHHFDFQYFWQLQCNGTSNIGVWYLQQANIIRKKDVHVLTAFSVSKVDVKRHFHILSAFIKVFLQKKPFG